MYPDQNFSDGESGGATRKKAITHKSQRVEKLKEDAWPSTCTLLPLVQNLPKILKPEIAMIHLSTYPTNGLSVESNFKELILNLLKMISTKLKCFRA